MSVADVRGWIATVSILLLVFVAVGLPIVLGLTHIGWGLGLLLYAVGFVVAVLFFGWALGAAVEEGKP